LFNQELFFILTTSRFDLRQSKIIVPVYDFFQLLILLPTGLCRGLTCMQLLWEVKSFCTASCRKKGAWALLQCWLAISHLNFVCAG